MTHDSFQVGIDMLNAGINAGAGTADLQRLACVGGRESRAQVRGLGA